MSLRSWVRGALFRLSVRLSATELDAGVRLVFMAPGHVDPRLFFDKLQSILGLIRDRDSRRWRRISEDLKTIALVPRGGEYYDASFRAYVMDVPTLTHLGIPELSLKVVHEATHARLLKCGLDQRRFDRGRVERLCMNQELAFAARLPNSQALATWVKGRMESRWWDEPALQARLAQQAAGYGIPPWLVRVSVWLGRLGTRTRRPVE
jgi:hypothetical protein